MIPPAPSGLLDEDAAYRGVHALVWSKVLAKIKGSQRLIRQKDDLFGEAQLDALNAIRKFRPGKKAKLSTYLARCVGERQKTHRKSYRMGAVRIPLHRFDKANGGLTDAEKKLLHEAADVDRWYGNIVDGRAELGAREREVLEARAEVARLLLHLDERDAEILRRRFGIGRPEETLEEVGKRYGVSKEAIRLRQAKALAKLRRFAEPA